MPLRASTSISKGIELFDAHSKLSAGTNATRVMPLGESTPTKQLSLGSLSFVCVSGEDSEKDDMRLVPTLSLVVLKLSLLWPFDPLVNKGAQLKLI